MKMDKENLVKNHFWVLLGIEVPLALVAIIFLLTVVGAQNAREREKLEGLQKKLVTASQSQLKNDAWVEAGKKDAEEHKKKEAKVWASAYRAQEDISTWPENFEKTFHYRDGLFALEIVVEGQEESKSEAESPPEDNRTFQGTVTAGVKDWIEVMGKDKQIKKFFRTDKVAVTIKADGKKAYFHDIKVKDQVKVTFQKGKFFNDPLTDSEREEYTRSYHSQIDKIIRLVDPVDEKGNGVVQLKGWFYKEGTRPPKGAKFFSYMADDTWKKDHNISDEAWLAQEDLWIQRELYRLVRLANDYVSKCKPATKWEKGKWCSYTNPYWKLDLLWAGGKNLEIKIHNLLDRRQKLDLNFRISFHQKLPAEIITISGSDPLNPITLKGDSFARTIQLKDGVNRTGIYDVEQVLTWETAAVKRIDHLSIGNISSEDCAHSHRTMAEGTRPLKEEEKTETTTTADSNPMAPPGGTAIMPMPQGGGGYGYGSQGADQAKRTINGFIKDRYWKVTPQSRRLPVGIVLIVDQYHMDRVQTAFANSKLRFLTTQLIVSRYPQSMRPNLSLDMTGTYGPGAEGENMPGYPMPMPMGGGSYAPPPMPTPRAGPAYMPPDGTGYDPYGGMGNAPADDQESNVEMVIYGIVTLYERNPPEVENSPAPTESN